MEENLFEEKRYFDLKELSRRLGAVTDDMLDWSAVCTKIFDIDFDPSNGH